MSDVGVVEVLVFLALFVVVVWAGVRMLRR